MIDLVKICATCKVEKSLDEFNRMTKSKDGRQYECRQCASDRHRLLYANLSDDEKKARKQRQRDHERANPEQGYWRRIKSFYGLTRESFEELLASQNGRCAICKTEDPQAHGRWCVDHDHACCPGNRSCGQCVRGLLCNGCNHGLGNFRDSVQSLRDAILYLEGT